MDEALHSPSPDRFWESAWAVSGPDKEIKGEPALLVLLLLEQKSLKNLISFPQPQIYKV